MSTTNNHISYIEFKTNNIEAIKTFYSKAFNWSFSDFGPSYSSFKDSGLQGGFEFSEDPVSNSVLVVLYHQNLEQIKNSIVNFGGKITKNIFAFPGGKRFHFMDPSGNELAVWSDK